MLRRAHVRKATVADADGFYWFGIAFETVNQLADAKTAYLEAIAKDPRHTRAYVQLLDVYNKLELAESKESEELVSALRKLPQSHETLAAITKHDRSGRASLGAQCIKLNPSYLPCYTAAIERELRTGNKELAREFFEAALLVLGERTSTAAFKKRYESRM